MMVTSKQTAAARLSAKEQSLILSVMRRGGMFCPAKKGYTEEDYYFSEWSAAERENGEHLAVMKFVRLLPTPPALFRCGHVAAAWSRLHKPMPASCLL